ncbi:MAG: bL9 family ribosomal protein, partial [Dehalococcoidia bacterium]|nr:bL9 family ribosomal protein [Dehalococcoidia bacterium]
MKVVFLQDVPNVAKAGDVKEVATGYGRNYLLPKKLAVLSK